MRLLQVTTAFLLLCHLSSSQNSSDVDIASPTSSPTNPTTKVYLPTPVPKPATEPISPTPEIPKATTSKDSAISSFMPTLTAIPTNKSVVSSAFDVTKSELITTNTTRPTLPRSDAVPTTQGFQHTTENQSSIQVTTMAASTQQAGASSFKTTVFSLLPGTSVTPPGNTSQLQGLEEGKNTTYAPTLPAYSSIILPVVIALIVITLSVFVLVGLYRMCWKKDPGTPENGNDQPQSDKESVKLLTVKTISHESGEHSVQGKTKN